MLGTPSGYVHVARCIDRGPHPMKRARKVCGVACVLAVVLAALALDASAQTAYPSKPIRMIIGLSPGGSTDLMARAIGARLTTAWGQQVVTDNRTGANGIVASQIVAKASPDGYTLLMVAIGHAANASLYRKLPYDTLRDFTPIILAVDVPLLLVVHPQLNANTVTDLIARARAKPGQLNAATAGVAGSSHLAMELFRIATKIEMLQIHYKGAGPALLELVAGRMDMMFAPTLASIQYVKAGRLNALAVTSPQRVSIAPDLPTIAESGVPGYEARAWYGLVGPAGVNKDIVLKLNRQINEILRDAEFGERLNALGAVPMGGTADEFGDFIRREVKKYAVVVKEAGIRAE